MEKSLKNRYLKLMLVEARYSMFLNDIILFKLDDPGDVRWLSACVPRNPRNTILIRFILGVVALVMLICYIPLNVIDTFLALIFGVFSLSIFGWLFVTYPDQVKRESDYNCKIRGYNNILKLSNDYLEELLKLRNERK